MAFPFRAFNPTSIGIDRTELYACVREATLEHSGEWMRHLPSSAAPQWFVATYQYMPAEASISADYSLSGSNPIIRGFVGHLETAPALYREGDSVKPARGSQFEIRGLIYNAKRVEINHVGRFVIELVIDDKCAEMRPEFAEEVEAQKCLSEPICVDIS